MIMADEKETELCKLFYNYNSDKCNKIKHTYSDKYYNILKEIRFTASHIIEIGIGTHKLMKKICGQNYKPGASLRAWRDFFPCAYIFGLDIDSSVLFEEFRIKCFYTDQSSSDSLRSAIMEIKLFTRNENQTFDLIIDDGSHQKKHIMNSFVTLFPYVKNNGFYIIEDINKKFITDIEILDHIYKNSKIELLYSTNKKDDNFIIFKKIQ